MTSDTCSISPQSLLKLNDISNFSGLLLSNRFIILDSLEQSIYGCVKLGYDKLNECKVAIKISCLNWSNKQSAWTGAKCLENIQREVAVMKYLGLYKNILNSNNNNHKSAPSPTQSPINSPRSYYESKSSSTNSDDEYDSPLSPSSTNSIMSDISSSSAPTQSTHGSQYFAHLIADFRDNYFHYLITEFIEGGDLFNVLLQLPEQRMPISVAKILFQQLVDAVAYLHNRGCAHLDLSLENICLRPNGTIAIIDFGLATIHPNIINSSNHNIIENFETNLRLAKQDDNVCGYEFLCESISGNNVKPGKTAYMSYELNNGKDWDAYMNDIFSIGVVLYTMTSGKPPFKQAKDNDVWYHVISTGKWLTQKIRSQSSARVYNELDQDLLLLIDTILKPQEKRAKLHSILNSNWLIKQL